MSRRRKTSRGNPAASPQGDSAPEEAARKDAPRGLRAHREAKRQGRSISQEPQRRAADFKDGFLSEANQRATEGVSSNPKLLVYALLGVAVFMFIYLHLYALPQMTYFAGGFAMPDARLMGYDAGDVERLRSVMDETGTGQLNFLHKTAGIIFPVSFALASWAVAGLVMRRGVLRWVLVGAAVVFAALDITENFLIDRILTMDPLDEGLVAASSALTVVTWGLLILVGAVVIGAVIMSIVKSSVPPRT